jgi:hypothetical protein
MISVQFSLDKPPLRARRLAKAAWDGPQQINLKAVIVIIGPTVMNLRRLKCSDQTLEAVFKWSDDHTPTLLHARVSVKLAVEEEIFMLEKKLIPTGK